MPLRDGGADAGDLFLADKEGGFTEKDEALVLPVASRAAAAMAEAPEEGVAERLRADFDALVHTVPVGVVVFDAATGDPLGPDEAARLRSGMSGQFRIVTYSNPKALLVPIDAVDSGGGRHFLQVVDPATGEAHERAVEIGPTTRNSVEIRAGLEPGETIVAPRS